MDFLDFLEEHAIPTKSHGEHHHATPNRIQLNCPLCDDGSQSYRMGYHLIEKYLSCWVCGYVKTYDAVVAFTGNKKLAYDIDKEGRKNSGIFSSAVGLNIHTDKKEVTLPELCGLKPVHLKKLEERRIQSNSINFWKLSGTGHNARCPWSIFIPIYFQGKLVSWCARKLKEYGPRYIMATDDESIIAPSNLIFGEDWIRHTAFIVEGPLDAMIIGKGAACTFGTGVSDHQVMRLSRFPRRVVCFDNEHEAQKRAENLCRRLSAFGGETIRIQLESGKDPGDASEEELGQIRGTYLREYLQPEK